MADIPVFGVFHEEKSLALGEPYDTTVEAKVPDRRQGKQFRVPDCNVIKGNKRDAWLDKTMPLIARGDHYTEPSQLNLMVKTRTGPGPEREKPFRPVQPPAKSGRAAGSLYGTFGPSSGLLDTDATLGEASGRPNTVPADKLRNIYTSTPKRGGAGYPDQCRLLGGKPFDYLPDEYQRARIVEKAMKHEARGRIHRPFLGGTRVLGCFSPDSQLYARPPPEPASRSQSASTRPAWRPNNPAAKGPSCGHFSSPQYIACPEPATKFRARDSEGPRPFVPTNAGHKRLSMWSVNPYERDARPPPDLDIIALG